MSNLTLEERETHFSISAADRSIVRIYSDDEVWVARLRRMGITVAKEAKSGGVWFDLPANQLTVRKARVLTDEQRAELSARAKNLQQAKKAKAQP